jgi:glycosyltransferase involved in cell wall biosynthesis
MLFFDLSSLLRWSGPPVGIVRVQQKYADYARRNIPEVRFTVFDPTLDCWREIAPEWIDPIIRGDACTDMSLLPDASGQKRRLRDRMPRPIRNGTYWVLQSRRKALDALEGIRLTAGSGLIRQIAGRLAEPLISAKHRSRYYAPDGRRLLAPPYRLVAGKPALPGPHDTYLAAQSDWSHTNVRAIADLKCTQRFRHVVLCHDIIPIMFPQWYYPHDVASFTKYFQCVLPLADRLIFTSNRVREDVTSYAAGIGVDLADTRIVPLGCDPYSGATGRLPSQLESGRYILFVATLEPRKNHRMLVEIWKRLLDDGIPQQTGIKLVFVGRPGWKMEGFFDLLTSHAALAETLHCFSDIDDETLSAMYSNAAFCVYPSLYEGFGLPVVEALAHGIPLIVSAGGALPEVAQGCAIVLSPLDEPSWEREMRHWMMDPSARNRFAVEARKRFQHRSWDDSAQLFFANVQ